MRLIVMYKNEMMDCMEDIEQAHFYNDKVIMNKLPLNVSILNLDKVASINCQDISIEQLKELQDQLALTEKALELACEELMEDLTFESEDDKHYTLQANIEYFKTKAKEMMKSEFR